MMTVQIEDFASNIYKYLDFDNFKPFAIVNELGQRITLAMPKMKAQKKPGVWMPTAEELEEIRVAREEYARGEYYSMRDDESLDEFLDRIESDPEGWLECNLKKQQV